MNRSWLKNGHHFKTHWLTWFVSEYGLANRTRPHPELGVLCCFRVASQMFAETSLIHVVFTTHRARVIGRSTFGHIRTSTDIRVTCEKRSMWIMFTIFSNILSSCLFYWYCVTHFVRRPATRWSDRCGGLSCVRPVTRYLGTVYGTADKT